MAEISGGRTLESLYLDPLRKRVTQHKSEKEVKLNGRVHPGGPVFTLMIDIKADGEAVIQRLSEVLPKYQDVLCRVENGRFVMKGNACDLVEDKDVQEFYMGVKSETSAKGYQRWKRKKAWR